MLDDREDSEVKEKEEEETDSVVQDELLPLEALEALEALSVMLLTEENELLLWLDELELDSEELDSEVELEGLEELELALSVVKLLEETLETELALVNSELQDELLCELDEREED